MTANQPRKNIIKLVDAETLVDKKRCRMSGSKNDDFMNVLARQAVDSLWLANSEKVEASQKIQATLVGMMGAAPQDEIEGMLAAQMMAAHNAAMECYRRAMIPEQPLEGRKENLAQATKLSRTFALQMEALNRYRGKGQQKMTVEHVHVHAGGQAIVGNVNHPEGGGVQKKTEEQAHAKQITHAPEQAMPSQNQKHKAVPVPRDA